MPEQLTLDNLVDQAQADIDAHDIIAPEWKQLNRFLALWDGKTPAEYYGKEDDSSADPLP